MSDYDAAKARLEAAWPEVLGAPRVYEPNGVPKGAASPYVVLTLDTGTPVNRRLGGPTQASIRRIVVAISARRGDVWQRVATAADAAFRDRTLSEFSDPGFCIRELAGRPDRDPDDAGWLYGLHTYTY